MQIEKKIESMGYVLRPVGEPPGNFVRSVRVGNLVFMSGFIPQADDRMRYRGRLGENINIEEAYQAARQATLNLLSILRAEIGDLDRVKRIVKLTIYVNASPQFDGEIWRVGNGASDLLIAVFGDKGKHARSTVGVATAGGGYCLEIEMTAEVD